MFAVWVAVRRVCAAAGCFCRTQSGPAPGSSGGGAASEFGGVLNDERHGPRGAAPFGQFLRSGHKPLPGATGGVGGPAGVPGTFVLLRPNIECAAEDQFVQHCGLRSFLLCLDPNMHPVRSISRKKCNGCVFFGPEGPESAENISIKCVFPGRVQSDLGSTCAISVRLKRTRTGCHKFRSMRASPIIRRNSLRRN